MIKTLTFISLSFSFMLSAQCNIVGKSSITKNEIATYTIENDIAQCPDCHLWIAVGNNAQLESDFKKNSVKIKPLSSGRTVLSLSILSDHGLVQCSKNIDILADGLIDREQTQSEKINCDITTNNFKEVKYDVGMVTFFPNDSQKEYKYTWKVNYSNGEIKESNEKIPKFPYSEEKPITKVSVKVVSLNCMKEFSKTYDKYYWKFF